MGYPGKKDLPVYVGDDHKWPMQVKRAQEYADVVVTAGDTTITSATAAFTSDDVGVTILYAEENLTATIASVTSPTEAELATAPAKSVAAATIHIWRPLDLTGYTLSAVGRAATNITSPVVITFTVTVTTAAEGRFDLTLPKTESVKVETELYWDLQTVDGSGWTETILEGKVRPRGQVTP